MADVTLKLDELEGRAVLHALAVAVQLLDEVGAAPDAPLYGQRNRLVAAARRLDHELNCPPASAPVEGDARSARERDALGRAAVLAKALNEVGRLAVRGIGQGNADCEDLMRGVLDLSTAALQGREPIEAPSASEGDAREASFERSDGLTDAEGAVMDALCEAANAFGRVEKQHPNEAGDFVASIHRAQDLLAVRIARRCFPRGWPTYRGGVVAAQGAPVEPEAGGEACQR